MSLTRKNIYGPIPVVTRGKPTLIGGDPKGDNILYCVGSNVVIRNVKNPLLCDIYSEHSKDCTVARYAPSGFYIASADVSGTVRIWDTTQAEHPLKIELKIISGPIYDIDWSEDSKRLVAVGEGKEKFGAVVMWDTGASVGEISGHSKAILTAAFKPTRPYRLVTGSEDNQVSWFEGPPFKFKRGITEHSKFVNCVRFSPNGNHFVSVGQDKKGVIYDGKEGTKVGEFAADGAHKLGIYCCSWNKEGTQILTASADKTAKLWDASTGKCITTFTFGDAVEDQQLGCLWQGDTLISLSLNGDLALLDPSNPSKPRSVIRGHNKFITALAVDQQSRNLYTGSYDSVINKWDSNTAAVTPFKGKGHTNQVVAAHISGGNLVTAGKDDSARVTSLSTLTYGDKVGLDGQPADVAAGGKGVVAVAGVNGVNVIRNNKIVSSAKVPNATAVAVSPDESLVVVGAKDFKITVFSLQGDQLKELYKLDAHRGEITRLAFSPDGKLLASSDTNREILVWPATGKEPSVRGWVFHNARVNDLAWHTNSNHLASVSLDQSIIIWNVKEPNTRIQFKNAHQGGINAVRWLDDTTLVTAGQDCSAKTWTVKF